MLRRAADREQRACDSELADDIYIYMCGKQAAAGLKNKIIVYNLHVDVRQISIELIDRV